MEFITAIVLLLGVLVLLMLRVLATFEGRIKRLETFPEYNKPSKLPARRPRGKW